MVIFLHGIASHAGWFGETASELEERGVAVYAMDRDVEYCRYGGVTDRTS